MRYRLFGVVAAIVLFVAQAFIGESLRKSGAYWVTLPRVVREMDPLVARILSFGHLELKVDWLWLRVLQDPEIYHVSRETRSAIYYELDLITKLDPAFYDAYMWGSILLSVIRQDGLGAQAILQRGEQFRIQSLPHYNEEFQNRFWKGAWGIPFTLAYVYFFDLDDLPRATTFYRIVAELPGTPAYLKTLTKKLETVDGQYEAGIKILGFMKNTTNDQEIIEGYEQRQRWLTIGRFLYNLNEDFEKYLESKKVYQATDRISQNELESHFEKFLKVNNLKPLDPYNGRLFINLKGNIDTETQRKKVFGMKY